MRNGEIRVALAEVTFDRLLEHVQTKPSVRVGWHVRAQRGHVFGDERQHARLTPGMAPHPLRLD